MKVFSPFLNGDTTTSGSLNLPQHPNTGSISNPRTGSLYHDTTDNLVKIYTGTQWQVLGEQAIVVASADIEYLLIAGGGGGGSYGGGGAGGYLSSSLSSVTSGSTFTVTVGTGGAGSGNTYEDPGAQGVDSSIAGASISTITALGGGYGGDNNEFPAADGGSGGGGSDGPTDATGGTGTVGQGNDGGDGSFSDPHYMGGGGGGAGAAGGDGTATGTLASGPGGDGLASSITGTSVTRAGGGGGVRFNTTGTIGAGGSGGGGNGGTWSGGTSTISSATAGTANTGGGGGAGQNGGSGVAIFAYPTASISATGGVRTFFNDRVAHTFNSSGTFSVGGTKTYTHNTLDVFGDSSCIALYKLDGNANDAGGNYNGTSSNVTYAQSYINDGGVFNGSSSKITLPSGFLDSAQTLSFSVWVNPTSFVNFTGILDKYIGSTSGWTLDVPSSTGKLPRIVTHTSGGGVDTIATTALALGNWTHIVGTITTNEVKIYVNGNLENTSSLSSPLTTNTTPLVIGGDGVSTLSFDGKLDQVRIFNKVLSALEVTTLYAE